MFLRKWVACHRLHFEQDPPRPIFLWALQHLPSSMTLPKNPLPRPWLREKMLGLYLHLHPHVQMLEEGLEDLLQKKEDLSEDESLHS